MSIKQFFKGMYEMSSKMVYRIESIVSDPRHMKPLVAILIVVGFVILAMSFGIIK